MNINELMALANDDGQMDRRGCIGKATGRDIRYAYEELIAAIQDALDEARAGERERLLDLLQDIRLGIDWPGPWSDEMRERIDAAIGK